MHKIKKALGIFRGFPGLGRVVAGVSLLESLRDNYGYDVRAISYLQGKTYLDNLGFTESFSISPLDYCAIGILPTSRFGAEIHKVIREFNPDIVIIDGEPLMIQSIKTSHRNLPVVSLLNPSDVDNPENDIEAMDFFRVNMSMADCSIIHGLRQPTYPIGFSHISIATILRREILQIKHNPKNIIYCILGGGTVNVENSFIQSTVCIGKLCIETAALLPHYEIRIACSSPNIYDTLKKQPRPDNVSLHGEIMNASSYYSDASLIITRSGRNTLSELLYLGIPAITFVSGCAYRQSEQRQNLDNLSATNIYAASLAITPSEMSELCSSMITKEQARCSFVPGNDAAIKAIINLTNK